MSGQVVALIAAFAIGVPLVTWGLIREQERCDRERRLREFLARSPEAQRIKAAFEEVAERIGADLVPALRQVAAAFAPIAIAMRAALADPETETDRSEEQQ